jgi:hypothetical protein
MYTFRECRNLVEHQLRLFETLSELDADVDLLALLPDVFHSIDRAECIRRLERCGVRWQSTWGEINSQRFWEGLASAKVVFLRPGNHLCVSWRMTDLLAMGACVVYDGAPYPSWYQPLLPNVHYVDGGCAIAPDHSLPPDAAYGSLRETIADLLNDEARIRRTRVAAADYFDRFCTPQQLGAHVLGLVTRVAIAGDRTLEYANASNAVPSGGA